MTSVLHRHGRRLREEADDYPHVVARLNEHWRVIKCRDGIQWILQRRAGQRHGQPRWGGRSYCATREALLRCVHENTSVDAGQIAALADLPDRIEARP